MQLASRYGEVKLDEWFFRNYDLACGHTSRCSKTESFLAAIDEFACARFGLVKGNIGVWGSKCSMGLLSPRNRNHLGGIDDLERRSGCTLLPICSGLPTFPFEQSQQWEWFAGV